jgi:hypothetical protein
MRRKKLHTKELYALYISPNIIRFMESRKIRWARYVECIYCDTRNPEKGNHLGDLEFDGRIRTKVWML